MKFSATAFCLLTIVVNTATAFSGGSLFCKHETGDSHVISKAAHESESHLDSCHSPAAELELGHDHPQSCNSCTDTEIENKSDMDRATSGSDRSLVKSPAALLCIVQQTALELPTPRISEESHPARAPPIFEYTLAVHIESTVLRV